MMLPNQINFAYENDYGHSVLHNSHAQPIIHTTPQFDVIYCNNNNNMNTNVYYNPSPMHFQQNIPQTQNTIHNSDNLAHLSHVTVSAPLPVEDMFQDPSIWDTIQLDDEFLRTIEGVTLSSPASPEPQLPPTDDMKMAPPTPVHTCPPTPSYAAPPVFPRKLSNPLPLQALPGLVDFPPTQQQIQTEVEAHLFRQEVQPNKNLNYNNAQNWNRWLEQMQIQQRAYVDFNNYVHARLSQQMRVQKTQSFPEDIFRIQALQQQQPLQYRPYPVDDSASRPPKLHKVSSLEESTAKELTDSLANAVNKKTNRKLIRRKSESNVNRNRSNSSPHPARRPRRISLIRDPKVEALLSDTNAKPVVVPSTENRFRLLHEPNPQQRKSYQNENRYLAPSPLIVMARTPEGVAGGDVFVEAVHAGDLTFFPKNVLGESETRQCLDEGGQAQFVMKCAETTGNQQVKLKFTVRYVANDTLFEEIIYSQGFCISSHTGKRNDLI